MNILFTCVGRRNYLLGYFREFLSSTDCLIATDMDWFAPGMQEADVSVCVPSIYDPKYIPSLLSVIEEYQVDAVISLNDLELPILSKHRVEIEEIGAKLLVSNEWVVDITFDKLKTAHFLSSIGIKTPKTFISREEYQKNGGKYPLVLKPRWGSASIGIDFPETERELLLAEQLAQIKLDRTILRTASQENIKEALLFQEFVKGKEYGMDILNDFEGNYMGTFVRKKLSMRAGETDKAVSVIDERFEKIGRTISEHLRHIGNLDCDILEQDGVLYVLELNPRFGGGYPFSYEAGARSVACYCQWLKGEKNVAEYLNYQPQRIFVKCDRLVEVKTRS